MSFEIISSYGNDRICWQSLIEALTPAMRDIHFLPEYGEVYQKTYGYEPFLAVYSDAGDFVMQPFVKRSLNELPFLREQDVSRPYYDITNSYGYGGPVCSCEADPIAKSLVRRFETSLLDYCYQEGYASEFTSCHPFLENHKLLEESGVVHVNRQKEIVYFDLTCTVDELWRGLNRGHKSSVNKARNSGVAIAKVEPVPENLAAFNRLYYATMERNRAAERWFFPKDYFQNCCDCLGPERTSLFFAYVDGVVASAYFLMHDFHTVYYHFGGSASRFYDLRPNNLLMYETALWAKERGYSEYHLGGGVTSLSDDNLFRFKRGFSSKTKTLYTYHRVLNNEVYDVLCRAKEQHELLKMGMLSDSYYFPVYRR